MSKEYNSTDEILNLLYEDHWFEFHKFQDYMVVNFKAYKIYWGIHKLIQISILILKKKDNGVRFTRLSSLFLHCLIIPFFFLLHSTTIKEATVF
jgi:hypothetical protein